MHRAAPSFSSLKRPNVQQNLHQKEQIDQGGAGTGAIIIRGTEPDSVIGRSAMLKKK